MKKTKIVCTIGPASQDGNILEKLILNGMDVARINTSHSSEDEVIRLFNLIRSISKKHAKNTAVMIDLRGPKIRIGKLAEDIFLSDGQEIIFFTGNGNNKVTPVLVPKKIAVTDMADRTVSGSKFENSSKFPLNIIESININPEKTPGMEKDKKVEPVSLLAVEKFSGETEIGASVSRIPVDYPYFLNDIKKGCTVFIDDGLIECRISRIDPDSRIAMASVIKGGLLKSGKGINLPGLSLSVNSVTERDLYFLDLAIKLNSDFVAQSFIRTPDDLKIIKGRILKSSSSIFLIAKIEKHEAVQNFDSILELADGIMVARGDLGIELPAEDVPSIQKQIIKKTNIVGKPVITATQMLDSMIRNPRPTRAEVSDVANSILDGSDALMLSGETAAGKYPVEALQMMVKIIGRTEENIDYEDVLQKKFLVKHKTITESISLAACEIATVLNAKAIITATQSGSTARQVSKNKPKSFIIGASPDESVVRQLMISWGVIPEKTRFQENVNEMIAEVIRTSKNLKLIEKNDRVVITGGILVSKPGNTNFLHVKEID